MHSILVSCQLRPQSSHLPTYFRKLRYYFAFVNNSNCMESLFFITYHCQCTWNRINVKRHIIGNTLSIIAWCDQGAKVWQELHCSPPAESLPVHQKFHFLSCQIYGMIFWRANLFVEWPLWRLYHSYVASSYPLAPECTASRCTLLLLLRRRMLRRTQSLSAACTALSFFGS